MSRVLIGSIRRRMPASPSNFAAYFRFSTKTASSSSRETPAGARRDELEAVFVDNLKFAAERLGAAGIRLLIEPINDKVDIPGFFLTTARQALGIMEKVGSENLYLQYDIYHMQVMEGDLARTIEQNLGRIAHIQLADNPGRHEPGTGEINWSVLLPHLARLGYRGWVGAEYRPKAGTEEGLGWLAAFTGANSAAA